MHLLMLSAFRLGARMLAHDLWGGAQCTFWCSVLSDSYVPILLCDKCGSQCTFWCSVLSDGYRYYALELV